MTERRYNRDEVDAILGRAIEREHKRGELTHEDLVAAAREVGIPTEAIETAASEVFEERQARAELATLRQQQWRGFFHHLVPYLMVNGMLVTLNFLTTHFPWALFPILGWGVGLVSHFMAVVAPNPQRLERRLERQRDRERRRLTRQQFRYQAKGLDQDFGHGLASRIERDVGQGISAVLEAAAQRIAGGPPGPKRDGRAPTRVPADPQHESQSAERVEEPSASGQQSPPDGVSRRR
jgi:hypothetical protein